MVRQMGSVKGSSSLPGPVGQLYSERLLQQLGQLGMAVGLCGMRLMAVSFSFYLLMHYVN